MVDAGHGPRPRPPSGGAEALSQRAGSQPAGGRSSAACMTLGAATKEGGTRQGSGTAGTSPAMATAGRALPHTAAHWAEPLAPCVSWPWPPQQSGWPGMMCWP